MTETPDRKPFCNNPAVPAVLFFVALLVAFVGLKEPNKNVEYSGRLTNLPVTSAHASQA